MLAGGNGCAFNPRYRLPSHERWSNHILSSFVLTGSRTRFLEEGVEVEWFALEGVGRTVGIRVTGRIRTRDPVLISQPLCPPELLGRAVDTLIISNEKCTIGYPAIPDIEATHRRIHRSPTARGVRQVFAWGGWGWFGERHFLPMAMRRQGWFAGGIR